MSNKGTKNTGMGMVLLFVAALSVYFWQGGSGEDEPELAEEAALGRTSSSNMEEEEELTDAQEFVQNVTAQAPMELPQGGKSHGIIVQHTGFTLSYDTLNHNPFWVAWELTSKESRGRIDRVDEFMEDPEIPARHAVRESAYRGSGYSRGHMCPAGDQKWSTDAMHDSFYMSNMCPQTFELNKDWWDMLERAEREWARKEGSVYIVCGPIYDSNRKVKNVTKKKFFVGIPHRFFKVILSTRQGHEKAIGFIYRNDASQQYMEDCVCSVDDIERITGYDFFAPLEDKLENQLEKESNLDAWN